ncbi:hypothetical protein BDB01DRAFT_808615 [Pilobolus umbonatus]|nr:hypothetical protein BDB01DRAFT_808615 [Pilobolus umbonatus]
MPSLPFEVMEIVTLYLRRRDLYTCLSVCKLWYSVFIRLLYENIDFFHENELKMFFEAITIYPECIEAGKYVKSLDMTVLKDAEHFKIYSDADISFIDALTNCPSIEELRLTARTDIINALITTKTPILHRLKKMYFSGNNSSLNTECLNCLYQFRSSLSYLCLNTTSHQDESIITYLHSFPNLTSLDIEISSTSQQYNHLFDDILKHCPHLISFHYSYTGRITYAKTLNIEYPSLLHLEIATHDLYLQDIRYIKDRFTRLRSLTLFMNNKLEDEITTINLLMELKNLTYFYLNIESVSTSYFKSTLFNFWKHADSATTLSRASRINRSSFYYLPRGHQNISMALRFIKCPSTGLRETNCTVRASDFLDVSYEDCLEELGPYLNDLKIEDKYPDSCIDIRKLNYCCPSLTKLDLDIAHIMESHLACTSNQALSHLYLLNCHVDDTTFREIEYTYPQLQKLYLTEPHFIDDWLKKGMYVLQLPKTELRYFILEQNGDWYSTINFMVMKEVNSQYKCTWSFCSREKRTKIQTNDSIFNRINRFFGPPQFILKSSTVEEVQFSISYTPTF